MHIIHDKRKPDLIRYCNLQFYKMAKFVDQQTETFDNNVIAFINHIPHQYRSSHLRNYFSQFIECGGFECFHFRHRPEFMREKNKSQTQKNGVEDEVGNTARTAGGSGGNNNLTDGSKAEIRAGESQIKNSRNPIDNIRTISHQDTTTTHDTQNTSSENYSNNTSNTTITSNSILVNKCCCIVKLSPENYHRFEKMYHKKHWLNARNEIMKSSCSITKFTPAQEPKSCFDLKDGLSALMSYEKLKSLPELNPPSVMPHGNVGTPTSTFLSLVNKCLLPASIIKKLNLRFPKQKSKKIYSQVPFDYGNEIVDINTISIDTVTSASGVELVTEGDTLSKFDRKDDTEKLTAKQKIRNDKKIYKEMKDEKIEEKMIPDEPESEEVDFNIY